MSFGLFFLVLILILVFAAMLGIGIYNKLVGMRVQTDNAWSQIDVQLKRRYDLVPNLVETVKGYASHEKETLEAVIQARNSAMSASGEGSGSRATAENMLTSTLKSIFALSEAYPDLKANENFLNLQEELTSTENKIGFARQHYNDSVGSYMTARQTFPANVITGIFNFEPREFFELDAGESAEVKSAPDVSF